MNGPPGNGSRPGSDDEAEHPVFGRLRQLILWHRAALLLFSYTAGKWASIALAGLLFGALPQAEAFLALLELVTLAVLFTGLWAFTRLRPWSFAALLIGLLACTVPLSRESTVLVIASLDGDPVPATIALTRLDAPGLTLTLRLGIELVPLAIAIWLWFLRPLHRRVAGESPLASVALRPGPLILGVAAALFLLPALATGLYLSRVDSGTELGGNDAVQRVEAALASAGAPPFLCSAPSDVLKAPLVRPFYLVVFVTERPARADQPALPVAGLSRIDALSGATQLVDALPFPDTERASDLCRGLSLAASVRTWTHSL